MTAFEIHALDPETAAAAPFLVVSLFTPSYRQKAERMLASCRVMGLAAATCEVPAIHRSISEGGVDDPTLTKPAIIARAVERFDKPVLFVDADVVFRTPPERITALSAACDLAIYNWLADDWTDVWEPIEWQEDGKVWPRRFWGYRSSVDYFDPSQLICSGLTQLWGATEASRALLEAWQTTIGEFPTASDDECLDLAFNNRDNSSLRTAWLDKAHLRMPWWPHVRPVIDHPDPVTKTGRARQPVEFDHRKRFYPERAALKLPPEGTIPRWAIIDAEKGRMLEWLDGQFVDAGPFEGQFWT